MRLPLRAAALALAALPLAACAHGTAPDDRDAAARDAGTDVLHADAAPDAPPLDAPADAAGDVPADVPPADAAPPGPPPVVRITNAGTGWQIYPGGGYRYGPSVIVNADGSVDLWSCSPGANGAWDYVRYRHSTDGGHTWSADQIALQPTAGTRDAFSTCDPGAIKIGAYYYLGYTSTEDSRGTNNQLYLARATAPAGPYAKWDGHGWTGAPQPIVTYAGDPSRYGVGEPSLVLVRGRLYVYNTYSDAQGYTDLATVDDPTADDWPAHLVPHGHVITRRDGSEDSTDVKYVEALDRFVGISTFDRFGSNATINVYQSADGEHFEPAVFQGARVQRGAHNAGLSGDPSGHITPTLQPFVAYAYAPAGSAWGDWPTYLDPVAIALGAPGAPTAGAVSSIVGGDPGDWSWSGPRAWDGDPSTVWSSDSQPSASNEQWLWVDLGQSYMLAGVTLVPRAMGLAFPVDFTLEAAATPDAFAPIAGQQHTGYPNPGGAPQTFMFADRVVARYLRVRATTLGADDFGNHYFQLAELTPVLAPP